MKSLLVVLTIILSIVLILMFWKDFFDSLIPSWNTKLIPVYLRYGVISFFNIILPLVLFKKYSSQVNRKLILGYISLVNILYLTMNLLPADLISNGEIDFEAYNNYVYRTIYFIVSIIIIHIAFYIYLLTIKPKKAATNSG